VESTFLLHKPVIYGSSFANSLFLTMLLLHIIALRLNPWTGALWMIWTFILIVIVLALTTSFSDHNRATDVARHRLSMSCLAAFSWWGALQGFGPAIVIAIKGDDPSTSAYLGDQPGSFSPAFLFFLVGWAPFFFPRSLSDPPLRQAASRLKMEWRFNF